MSIENTHFGAKHISDLLSSAKKIFFIGVGGVSMSSLAVITKLNGFSVAGSDRAPSEITKKLESLGIEIFYGHDAEHIVNSDAVVYTVAISADNPEYLQAEKMGIPCISRADYLGYIMTFSKNRVGIAGMHGKSTCTSMCAQIYMTAGVDPTIVSGAEYSPMGGFYRVGQGHDFLFEACEYMDSFLDFSPTTAVLLNVELEHVDYFGTLERVIESYGKFAALVGDSGKIIYNIDDKNVIAAVDGVKGEKITFGLDATADFSARNISMTSGCPTFDIFKNGEFFTHIELQVPGKHNVYNALAAAAAAATDGISPEKIAEGLAAFVGAKRRMEFKGYLNGCRVYDDYGHHPTEIAATLDGARALCVGGRLICAFQSHTYSRTAALFDDFVGALKHADKVLLAPIYAAREENIFGISSDDIAAKIDGAESLPDFETLAKRLGEVVREGDLLVIMGAGSIEKVFDNLELQK